MTETTNAAAPPPAWAVVMKDGPPPDTATPAWAVALTTDEAERALRDADAIEQAAEAMIEAASRQRGRATLALTDEFACEALANIAEMLRRVRASRDRMTEVLPLPPAEVGPVLASLRVPRAAAQEALNEGLRAGEVRLARSEDGVLVVAVEGRAP